jgi:hypothetical protein
MDCVVVEAGQSFAKAAWGSNPTAGSNPALSAMRKNLRQAAEENSSAAFSFVCDAEPDSPGMQNAPT